MGLGRQQPRSAYPRGRDARAHRALDGCAGTPTTCPGVTGQSNALPHVFRTLSPAEAGYDGRAQLSRCSALLTCMMPEGPGERYPRPRTPSPMTNEQYLAAFASRADAAAHRLADHDLRVINAGPAAALKWREAAGAGGHLHAGRALQLEHDGGQPVSSTRAYLPGCRATNPKNDVCS